MSVTIETITGERLLSVVPDLARLRITVFREWPYLYDGNLAYEEDYLHAYMQSPETAVVVAKDSDRVVGASTCLPLKDEMACIRAPFEERGLSASDFFYFGESVLLESYRGQGIGVRFFEERERHARSASQASFAVFCAVRRWKTDPRRPDDAHSLADFWGKRGFSPLPGLFCHMSWKEPGIPGQRDHLLDFHIKPLRGDPIPEALLHNNQDED
ncbi:GNAT family N-acetyltransferase [Acetobacter sp.]|jgi:GNAT superfamily N-acetyltransferase|uniref:GNAT family N-acetyltransferase n=1 Tax=Acetobacter sp. TaxID=440 RepID=UPI0025C61007|nr:GNAT family N-acetyltransferase [Acetobacter sp.]MCH4090978.1 GNAT family N-acetyltransferase [Acetobacter sp.]MCI1300819.1 GNAT family N-acetyltransferase [Acetobacter sp.]MCI1317076.1 GNAT family N-acetyltransferase [Acetobacter sp.]